VRPEACAEAVPQKTLVPSHNGHACYPPLYQRPFLCHILSPIASLQILHNLPHIWSLICFSATAVAIKWTQDSRGLLLSFSVLQCPDQQSTWCLWKLFFSGGKSWRLRRSNS
jgi:hypothetical protein